MTFAVSLFTREWIEIASTARISEIETGLPLYEGVDWNCLDIKKALNLLVSLFTREWIEILVGGLISLYPCRLPLYEGVDWNSAPHFWTVLYGIVSLFTREWIEIQLRLFLAALI